MYNIFFVYALSLISLMKCVVLDVMNEMEENTKIKGKGWKMNLTMVTS